jgi:predicted transposase YbfD/YdcC
MLLLNINLTLEIIILSNNLITDNAMCCQVIEGKRLIFVHGLVPCRYQ